MMCACVPFMRNAWDGKTLQTMAKNSPLRATGAHIGIVGHITKQELLRHIAATELANGFFNRFMVVAVQRSKTLPFGGQLAGEDLDRVRERVRLAARFAAVDSTSRSTGTRANTGSRPTTSCPAGRPGSPAPRPPAPKRTPSGSRCSTRCSTAPTSSRSSTSRPRSSSGPTRRLRAWVFGDSIGDPTADEIWTLARDRHDGITRTEVSNLFSRNKKAREIDRALQALIDAGRLERVAIRDLSSNRTLTVWRPAGEARHPISDRALPGLNAGRFARRRRGFFATDGGV